MIFVKMMGGLGNQMFQYAAGRRLALLHGAELVLDLSWFGKQSLRHYRLDALNIRARSATEKEISPVGRAWSFAIKRLLARTRRRPFERVPFCYRERAGAFDPGLLHLPDDVCLEGYWQDERYFEDAAPIIRSELKPPVPHPSAVPELAECISARESVSLHVRRGDYVTNPVTADFHGSCDVGYFERAAGIVAGRVQEPHFFLFSDDLGWVRENLKLPYPTTIVDLGGARDEVTELSLMVRCRHHVISNSSFSWWAAWLSGWKDQIVVGPRQWFRDSRHTDRTPVPDRWLSV